MKIIKRRNYISAFNAENFVRNSSTRIFFLFKNTVSYEIYRDIFQTHFCILLCTPRFWKNLHQVTLKDDLEYVKPDSELIIQENSSIQKLRIYRHF